MAKPEEGSISSDLRALLESPEGADVVLVVGGSEFPAHSLILAARSPVFAAMLRTDMKEARSRRIEITDMQEDVLQQVLSFIYTDTAPKLGSVAAELLVTADKYDLPLLKKRCEERLAQDLSVANAAAVAALAVVHHCPGLRDAVVEFVAGHPDVLRSPGWSKVMQEIADGALEIYKQLAVVQSHALITKAPQNRIMTEEHRQTLANKLISAALNGQTGEVWALLQLGAPVSAKGADGDSALHKAADGRHEAIVRFLLDAGADVNIRDSKGRTPLHRAVLTSHQDHIIWMLLLASAHLDVQDNEGDTPLHLAARGAAKFQNVYSTQVLLLAGARRDIKNRRMRTPACEASISTKLLFTKY